MPYVVTANCIVCKDLDGNDAVSGKADRGGATERVAEATPRLPEHLGPRGADPLRTTGKPDADDPASG